MQRDLVEAARLGDHEAFEVLASSAGDRLYAIARLTLRDAHLAEDAVQDALVHAWRNLPTLRDPDRWDAWLYRLIVNACTDSGSAPAAIGLPRSGWSTWRPRTPIRRHSIDDHDQLDRGFQRLKPDQRVAVALHFYLGLTVPEVADALGVPLGTAKSSRSTTRSMPSEAALEADERTPVASTGGVTPMNIDRVVEERIRTWLLEETAPRTIAGSRPRFNVLADAVFGADIPDPSTGGSRGSWPFRSCRRQAPSPWWSSRSPSGSAGATRPRWGPTQRGDPPGLDTTTASRPRSRATRADDRDYYWRAQAYDQIDLHSMSLSSIENDGAGRRRKPVRRHGRPMSIRRASRPVTFTVQPGTFNESTVLSPATPVLVDREPSE